MTTYSIYRETLTSNELIYDGYTNRREANEIALRLKESEGEELCWYCVYEN